MKIRVPARAVLVVLSLLLTPILAHAESVWIDVRSEAEHQVSHIEGDPLIPHRGIVAGVAEQFPDRDTEIHLYCRSGVRAGKAKAALEAAGYTNVINEGGIDDAREKRNL